MIYIDSVFSANNVNKRFPMNKMTEEIMLDVLSQSLCSIQYNLQNVFGSLLHSIKLELEKDGHVGLIDDLIRAIIQTSTYSGPEGEQYPTWIIHEKYPSKKDEITKKEIQAKIDILAEKLKSHDITQFHHLRHWKGDK